MSSKPPVPRYSAMKLHCPVIYGFLLWILVLTGPVGADIYKYVDKNGVAHFTNVPTSNKFKPFFPAGKKRRSPRNTTRFDPLIQQASQKFNVDFSLIKAVIVVESAGNPRAVSPTGATGLMQVMPENFSRLGISDPFAPDQNIMGGTQYLSRLIQRFNGNLEFALAAYNAGPSAVHRYKGVPPFQETRRYIRRVMALSRTYQDRP